MRLTYFTDYSIRVLLYAATNNSKLSTIKEISELSGLSKNHLMKVVHHLGKRGYLHTVRGKNGGFRIAKKAEEINIGELIRNTEENLKFIENQGDEISNNNPVSHCDFNCVINKALKAFLKVTDRYTLEDLL